MLLKNKLIIQLKKLIKIYKIYNFWKTVYKIWIYLNN